MILKPLKRNGVEEEFNGTFGPPGSYFCSECKDYTRIVVKLFLLEEQREICIDCYNQMVANLQIPEKDWAPKYQWNRGEPYLAGVAKFFKRKIPIWKAKLERWWIRVNLFLDQFGFVRKIKRRKEFLLQLESMFS